MALGVNPSVLCRKEKAHSDNNLSVSEQNVGLRQVLLAGDADLVEADASKSPPDKLAAALEWTRRRENGLLDKVEHQNLKIAIMESAGIDEKTSAQTYVSESFLSN